MVMDIIVFVSIKNGVVVVVVDGIAAGMGCVDLEDYLLSSFFIIDHSMSWKSHEARLEVDSSCLVTAAVTVGTTGGTIPMVISVGGGWKWRWWRWTGIGIIVSSMSITSSMPVSPSNKPLS